MRSKADPRSSLQDARSLFRKFLPTIVNKLDIPASILVGVTEKTTISSKYKYFKDPNKSPKRPSVTNKSTEPEISKRGLIQVSWANELEYFARILAGDNTLPNRQ